jgi:hypothetical protein
MKKTIESRSDMRPEYNFSSMKGGIRGKHYEEYRKGTNIVLLKPEVAEAFPTEDAVNEPLRGIPQHNTSSTKDWRSPGSRPRTGSKCLETQSSPWVTISFRHPRMAR